MQQTYEDKSTAYFGNARQDIEPLLALNAERALEIGCGAGGTMRWLRETGRVTRAWGVELFEDAAAKARAHFEIVHAGDAESLLDHAFADMKFDLILCLDVLEHMVDPWRAVGVLEGLLAPTGRLVISVPNVRCLEVVLPLLVAGRWRYQDEGILDRTHLRFFTRESALSLAAASQLEVRKCLESFKKGSKLERFEKLTFGVFTDLTARQFLVMSSRASSRDVHA